jgi:hypothetical protein
MAANWTHAAWPAGPVAPNTPILTPADLHDRVGPVDPEQPTTSGSLATVPLVRILGRSQKRSGGPARPRPHPLPVGAPAPDIRGETPAGDPVEVGVARGLTTLVFLTSDCVECQALWRGVADENATKASVVLVTPDPSTQSRRALEALVPAGQVALMSSDAWHDYGVTGAPWCVVVEDGTVLASRPGGGSEWRDLVRRDG